MPFPVAKSPVCHVHSRLIPSLSIVTARLLLLCSRYPCTRLHIHLLFDGTTLTIPIPSFLCHIPSSWSPSTVRSDAMVCAKQVEVSHSEAPGAPSYEGQLDEVQSSPTSKVMLNSDVWYPSPTTSRDTSPNPARFLFPFPSPSCYVQLILYYTIYHDTKEQRCKY